MFLVVIAARLPLFIKGAKAYGFHEIPGRN